MSGIRPGDVVSRFSQFNSKEKTGAKEKGEGFEAWGCERADGPVIIVKGPS